MNTYKFLIFTFGLTILPVQSLIEIPAEKDTNIAVTEFKINDILNNLFSTLKLKNPRKIPRIQQYNLIHSYFSSISLQYHNYRKDIARMVSTSKTDSKIQYFIMQLNAIFDDDSYKNDEANQISHDENEKKYEDKYTYREESNDIPLLQKDNAEDFINTNISVAEDIDLTNQDDDQDSYYNETNILQQGVRRIFQGKRTKIKDFPFVASVLLFKQFQCAGSIIKSDLILTAASCLQLAWNNRFFRENPAYISVRVGSTFADFGGEVIPVLEVYFHPSYDPKSLFNNLAIMRLERALRLRSKNKKVKKISFDRRASPLAYNFPRITILGWGARGVQNILDFPQKNRLSYSKLDVYPLSECKDVYSKGYVTFKNFCAGFMSKGGGACNHDVGGPGISGRLLMGVVSFGSPICGARDTPTVFTKIGYYKDWIDGIMDQDVPITYKRTTKKPKTRHYDYDMYTYGKQNQIETDFTISPIIESINTELILTNPTEVIDDGHKKYNKLRELLISAFGLKVSDTDSNNTLSPESQPKVSLNASDINFDDDSLANLLHFLKNENLLSEDEGKENENILENTDVGPLRNYVTVLFHSDNENDDKKDTDGTKNNKDKDNKKQHVNNTETTIQHTLKNTTATNTIKYNESTEQTTQTSSHHHTSTSSKPPIFKVFKIYSNETSIESHTTERSRFYSNITKENYNEYNYLDNSIASDSSSEISSDSSADYNTSLSIYVNKKPSSNKEHFIRLRDSTKKHQSLFLNKFPNNITSVTVPRRFTKVSNVHELTKKTIPTEKSTEISNESTSKQNKEDVVILLTEDSHVTEKYNEIPQEKHDTKVEKESKFYKKDITINIMDLIDTLDLGKLLGGEK